MFDIEISETDEGMADIVFVRRGTTEETADTMRKMNEQVAEQLSKEKMEAKTSKGKFIREEEKTEEGDASLNKKLDQREAERIAEHAAAAKMKNTAQSATKVLAHTPEETVELYIRRLNVGMGMFRPALSPCSVKHPVTPTSAYAANIVILSGRPSV